MDPEDENNPVRADLEELEELQREGGQDWADIVKKIKTQRAYTRDRLGRFFLDDRGRLRIEDLRSAPSASDPDRSRGPISGS